MRQETYADVRDRVRAGDVIAFGGRGLLSHIVKVAGGSNVSHAGAIVAEAGPGREPQFVESTVDVWADPPVYRVAISSFEDRCRTYDGEVWWLPLGDAVRRALDVQAFVDFMRNAGGQRFDIVGGMTVTLIELFRRVTGTEQQRQLESYFCSELVAKALRDAGAVKNLDSPWVSPTDLCRWSIYEGDYSHLRPDAENQNEIVGYNSRPPGST